MKLISFSGAQSTGKTTLLKRLADTNYDQSYVKFIPEVTRLINREFNLPINEGAGGMTQLLINAHHVENIFKNEPTYVETKVLDRCILDGFVYTEFLREQSSHMCDVLLDRVNTVSQELFNSLITKYDIIFYTSPVGVSLEKDGERSSNEGFRNNIILLFELLVQAAKDKGANIVTLNGSVEDRLEQIKAEVDRLNIRLKV